MNSSFFLVLASGSLETKHGTMLSLLKAEGEKFISQCLADREMATVDEGETAKTEGETQKKIRRETKRKRKEKKRMRWRRSRRVARGRQAAIAVEEMETESRR